MRVRPIFLVCLCLLFPFAAAGPQDEPLPPSALTATAGPDGVHLEWLPPASEGSSGVTAYQVYRIVNATRTMLATVAGDVTEFLDTAPVPESLNSFYVTAVNDAGESLPSNAISIWPWRCPFWHLDLDQVLELDPSKPGVAVYPQCLVPAQIGGIITGLPDV